ncbi:DUF1345 domain-containing protein [Sphingomonas ginkgonis]|uniref:DUF1345 domain-containing protein n=1 Tax=Sphingomonas ginkgonis TaxID=2315330 RepID=A0A3R9WNF5_9SPHN|nr:DUF1345 domain-containing protein [Sphingomonas ginkgonis]RST29607.1 DUF1345 domain-containing protein [Sphingomonas ginkgonis]
MAETGIGSKLAPPRFLLFLAVLAAGIGAAFVYHQRITLGFLAAFDLAALVFLASVLPMLMVDDPNRIREQARRNDANRTILLAITFVVTGVVLVAIASESSARHLGWPIKALIIATIIIAWLFSNVIYTFHYAHLAYGDSPGQECRSLSFPKTEAPIYWDFIYFAFTLGMTFQTSDVDIQDQRIRKVTVAHCLAAFFYNIGVLAFTINVLGSSSGG